MNTSNFLPPPVRLSQAFDGVAGGGVTRRLFIKRTGGATVASIGAWNLSTTSATAADESDGSWLIKLDSSNPGDGANQATQGAKSKYGWNWKSALVTINGSQHLLTTRWQCTPNPKHPTDLVGTKKEAWDFGITFLAQVRSNPGAIPVNFPSNGQEDYMVYGGQYYGTLVADAGFSGQAGSSGTVTLQETLVPFHFPNGTEIQQCKISHNPVDDHEEFYANSTEQYKLILAVRSNPVNGDQASSHSYQAVIVAGIIKEMLPVSPSSFKISYTPPTQISIDVNVTAPPGEGTTVKITEITTSMGLGFVAIKD
ncbi:hypothetical protein ACFQY0_19475 [Haloferula chungangensis]|uniref:Twin-arginine translocation signal domain-containing protein n=1 Tax=Haloferula chungangensis TaxID=1048331 RepID=A0ABW2LAB4_9BACT